MTQQLSRANNAPQIGRFAADSGRSARLVVCVALLTVVAGCAGAGGRLSSKPTIEELQTRAVERSSTRWKALTDKRFDEAYAFLSEASRATTNTGEYSAAMGRMGYQAAKVEGAVCTESLCTVRTQVTIPIFVRNVGARPQTFPIEEQWVVDKGELWLIRR